MSASFSIIGNSVAYTERKWSRLCSRLSASTKDSADFGASYTEVEF